MPQREPAIYIMANKPNGTIYVGVTSHLVRRVYEHKHHLILGFTQKYDCHRLVYYEYFEAMYDAISREKQIKAGKRKKKIALIEAFNPPWHDLYNYIC
jgi:putative endonuclease